MKERGIVLSAFGKRGYVWAAYNLAYSIKYHCPEMHITLLHDDSFHKDLLDWQKAEFDNLVHIPDHILYRNGKIEPANVKVNIYQFLPYQYNLFIDVDAKAMQSLNIIFDELIAEGGYYYSHIIGQHNIKQGREIPSMYWAYADDIWSQYNLHEDAILPSTNSSFQFIKKCDESKRLFERVVENYENPIPLHKLRNQWGSSQPDELYLNIALAQVGLMPKTKRDYMWMANEPLKNSLSWIAENYPLLCLFGDQNKVRAMYTDYYDRCLINEFRKNGKQHFYKWHKIRGDKHANTKPNKDGVNMTLYREDISVPSTVDGSVNLYIPFYQDKRSDRNAELIKCLEKNLSLKNVDKVFLLCDKEIDIARHDKLTIITKDQRQTFGDLVKIANKETDENTINIICNTDIYFDERNINLIKSCDLIKYGLALSRYNVLSDNTVKHFDYQWSQDTWAWRGSLDTSNMNLDIPFGKPWCDSRFSFELNRVRQVINPSYSIKTYHLHRVASRGYSEADRLGGDGIPVACESAHKYIKKRMLFIQPGKVGDIILCLPIVKHYSKEYFIDWKCPKEYHSMFDYVDYARPVTIPAGAYDKTLDIAFGLGGAPEKFWQSNKHSYNSFVTLKYELAGVPIESKSNLQYRRNYEKEKALFDKVVGYKKDYILVHNNSTYGTPIKVDKENIVYFTPVDDYTIFDWRKVIENASEIHCIDSSLCNFVDAIPEVKSVNKYYYKTDKVPHQYDETLLTNNWTRV